MHEDHTPDLRKGQILCRALFLSVDPIIRLRMNYGLNPGDAIPGRQVARVIESKNKDYAKGKLVYGFMGWQSYSVFHPEATLEICGEEVPVVEPLPVQLDISGLPKSACLGVLGIPGLTAYIGLLHICKARDRETIVISSAGGQIGHIAGQIAKFMGLTVIGYTGDGDKASWLKTELNFDWVFNYKSQDVKQTLKIAAPKGVDVFLDGVGGIFHSIVQEFMAPKGRILLYGNLSCYDSPKNVPMVPANDLAVALKEISIIGFNVYRHFSRKDEALDQIAEWCQDGTIAPYEHVIEGFEYLPKAFIEMMEGKSQGKVIVRV